MLNQLQPILTQATRHKKGRKAKSRPIFVSKKTEVLYLTALNGLIDEMHQATLDELNIIMTPQVGDSVAVADGLFDRFTSAFANFSGQVKDKVASLAEQIAKKIVGEQKKASDNQLSDMLFKQTGIDLTGLMNDEDIEQAVNEAIGANVALIKSVPQQYLDRVEMAVLTGLQNGELNKTLADELQKIHNITKNRAELIASDQLAKINSRLSQIRQQRLGITHYTWRTSRDERVRHSHRLRDGKLIAWDNPPDDGHAGQAIRCRCVAEPYTEHLLGGKSPEEVMADQENEMNIIAMASEHLRQSDRLLHRKSSNGGLGAGEFLSILQTKKQGNPALRLSQALYDELQKKLGDVPPVWAVNHYTIHSKHINDLLRGRAVADEFLQASQNAVDGLDKLFANELATVKTPFTVWRGEAMRLTDLEAIQNQLSNSKEVGYSDLAFRSTSLNPNLAKEFSGRNIKEGKAPVIFKINVTQGMKALDISSYHFYTGDNEILLNRGSVMNIKQITKNTDGSFEIEADVVPMPKGNVADSKPQKIVKTIEVVDDEDYEDNPRDSRWSCGGTLIFYA